MTLVKNRQGRFVILVRMVPIVAFVGPARSLAIPVLAPRAMPLKLRVGIILNILVLLAGLLLRSDRDTGSGQGR